MIVHQDYTTYLILGEEVHIISDIIDGVRNTVALFQDKIHYLGNEVDNLTAAIFAWQDINERLLSQEELKRVLYDNHITQDS
jgi:hypothetical protein